MTKTEIKAEFSKKGRMITSIGMTYDNQNGKTELLYGYVYYTKIVNGIRESFEIDDIHSLIINLIAGDWRAIDSISE